jgi:hypothetical protein
MVEESSKDRGGLGRKELLAGALLLVMFALMGRMIYFVWREGDTMCQALQAQLEHIPSARMPCSKTSYPVGPVDSATTQAAGAGTARSTVRYQFDDDGDLNRFDSDHGDGGAAEVTYRCSTLGKILMPITNFDAWSSFGAFEELARGGAPQVKRHTDDEGAGVPGLRTRLKVLGNPAMPSLLMVEASTRDEDDRLHRRVLQDVMSGRLTMSDYEYDASGNLRSSRQMFITHPHTSIRQTDYTYECWD